MTGPTEEPNPVAEPISAPDEQARAAWAAVLEMRRSLIATWVGVVVNLAVVLVALGAPLIQQHFEARALNQRHDELKTLLVTDISEDLRDSRPPNGLPKPENSSDRADPKLIAFAIDRMNLAVDFDDRTREEARERYSFAREFPDLNWLVEDYTTLFQNFRENALSARGELANTRDLTVGAVFERVNSVVADMAADYRHIRLLVDLNTEPRTGRVKPGIVLFGSCSQPEHKGSCNRPLPEPSS
jgi:hypothetical protein